MAEKKEATSEEATTKKTKKVEIIKLHPLVAHDEGEIAELEEGIADKLIELKYARPAK